MLTKLIKVGNSKGIRIPSSILKECQITDQLEMEVKNNTIIIKPLNKARQGWEEAFRLMSERKEDKLLIDNIDEEMDNWEWI
ncbi:MAG: AbrB/MazE/SpoVT family DNA-binding domain-containing protein [Candidatus Sericytochromatia bacterium]